MAQATVKTVQFVDPRIEPQPDPVYDYVIGPTQNQFYKIPASGLSDSNITFNNLTTLGVDRAYLDTFELEITAEITFDISGSLDNPQTATANTTDLMPAPHEWTFQSFPFNTCCDEARVNINGGAFFSQPMCYVRAKERYMNQYALAKCYQNVCPVHKPVCQTESGRPFNTAMTKEKSLSYNLPVDLKATTTTNKTITTTFADTAALRNAGVDLAGLKNQLAVEDKTITSIAVDSGYAVPTRYGQGMFNYMQNSEGMDGGYNNAIVKLGAARTDGSGYKNYYHYEDKDHNHHTKVIVTWREPLFVSPFSSRYDGTYGRPLYNITSMDFAFNLQNLGNMIRMCNYSRFPQTESFVKSYSVHIATCNLCYQVMTIPSTIQKPLTTLVPYRRFVPYITEFNSSSVQTAQAIEGQITIDGGEVTVRSGVYTMNEIPTAIWLFFAPVKADYQTNQADSYTITIAGHDEAATIADNAANVLFRQSNWETNKLFAYMKHVNISLANTTQILNTAEVHDLYRIAKANGCEDSFWSWSGDNTCLPKNFYESTADKSKASKMYYGAGSVLRLKPGVDIIVPDIPLIPGANANNMVFQAECKFSVPPHSVEHNLYALWILFEYVGVASISPGQCEITMNPLGGGEVMALSPVMSATSEKTEGTLEGSGFWDTLKRITGIAGQIADEGVISKILKHVPGAEKAASWAAAHGLGEPVRKRGRDCMSGGAVIGKGGLNDWI